MLEEIAKHMHNIFEEKGIKISAFPSYPTVFKEKNIYGTMFVKDSAAADWLPYHEAIHLVEFIISHNPECKAFRFWLPRLYSDSPFPINVCYFGNILIKSETGKDILNDQDVTRLEVYCESLEDK